jgi:hypothetical protein
VEIDGKRFLGVRHSAGAARRASGHGRSSRNAARISLCRSGATSNALPVGSHV